MKNVVIVIVICVLGFTGCHETTIGYLQTKNAEYLPGELVVRRKLNPNGYPDANMLRSGADWASNEISGVLGTNPLKYSLEDVKAEGGGDVGLFREQVKIIGGGRVYFPSKDIKAPNGTYILSIRVENPGYSVVLKDIFKVIIKEE